MNSISFGQADVAQAQVQTQTTTQAPRKITPAKTHAGMYTGFVMGAIGSAVTYGADKLSRSATGIPAAKGTLLLAAIPLIFNTCIGALIDRIRNKRAEKFAEETAGLTSFQAVEKDEAAELTPKGNPYINLAAGKKYGTLAFAIASPLTFALRNKAFPSLLGTGVLALQGAIGGLIFGAISDYFSNKTARQSADANPYPKETIAKTEEPAKK
ncbi:MAG: hypothetical protein K6A44_02725 [bacterium]|nr:hypothetical protein [bacterium]